MKPGRFLEVTKSWTRRFKRVLYGAGRDDTQPHLQHETPNTSFNQLDTYHPKNKQLPANEIADLISEDIFVASKALYELPFYEDGVSNEVDEIPTSEFTLFPMLPTEVRTKIWKHVCFIPRNVEVRSWNFGSRIAIPTLDINEENPWQVWNYRSNTVPPAVLSVCVEARCVGLKHYQLDWGTHYAFRGFTFSTPATIYVNYDSDCIVMTQRFHSRDIEDCVDFLERCFRKARFIAVNVKDTGLRRECDYIRPFLHRAMDNKANTPLEDIILFSQELSTNWPGKRINFERLPRGWNDLDDDCLIVLRRLRSWTTSGSMVSRSLGKVKEQLSSGPKFHFRHLSLDENRY